MSVIAYNPAGPIPRWVGWPQQIGVRSVVVCVGTQVVFRRFRTATGVWERELPGPWRFIRAAA